MPGFKQTIILCVIITLQGCVLGFDPENTTSAHHINIHDNPQIGDLAIRSFPMPSGSERIKWEVIGLDSRGILVRRSWLGDELSDIENEFVLSPEGQVRQATLIYKGKRYPQRIVQPPEEGSLQNLTKSKHLPTSLLQTKAGKFKVDAVQGYTITVNLGIGSVNSSSVEYLSDKVPFRILEVRSSFELDADPFIEFLTRATYTLEAIHDSDLQGLFQIDEQTADAEGIQYERLIQFEFAQ